MSALALHNDIINTAKWDHHGSTVEQEGGGCSEWPSPSHPSESTRRTHPASPPPSRPSPNRACTAALSPGLLLPCSPPLLSRTNTHPPSVLTAAATLRTDSYSIIFEEPEDAAKFCLQV